MVTVCAVVGCKERYGSSNKRKFYSFPKVKGLNLEVRELTKQRRVKWLQALQRKDITIEGLKSRRICDKHFLTGKPAHVLDTINPDWIPSVSMGAKPISSKSPKKRINVKRNLRSSTRKGGKTKRSYKREEKDDSVQLLEVDTEFVAELPVECVLEEGCNDINGQAQTQDYFSSKRDAATQTDDVHYLLPDRLREIYSLRRQLSLYRLDQDTFLQNDKKLKFYTGLPSLGLFTLLLKKIEVSLDDVNVPNLSTFQKFLITLMKLRSNASFLALSYRFNVIVKDVRNVFEETVIAINHAYKKLIHWPTRDGYLKRIPPAFDTCFHKKIAIIIDYLKIKKRQPLSFKIDKDKPVQCTKYLLALTPSGLVSFISEGYDGDTSDESIIQECGILDKLMPGDVLLTSHGSVVSEVKKERNRLYRPRLQKTHELQLVALHSKRLISKIRRMYRILNGPVPTHFTDRKYDNRPLLDYIVNACCILINLC